MKQTNWQDDNGILLDGGYFLVQGNKITNVIENHAGSQGGIGEFLRALILVYSQNPGPANTELRGNLSDFISTQVFSHCVDVKAC